MMMKMRVALARFGQATLLRAVIVTIGARGIIAFIFGVVAFLWPGLAVGTLATLFALWVFLDGIIAVFLALADLSQHVLWWGHLGEGALGIIIGLVTFFRANITDVELLYLVIVWSIVLGILEILIAFWTRNIARESWLTFIAGWVALLSGLVLLIRPAAGAMASLRVIVLYALVLGILHLTCAVRIARTGAEQAGSH
jgi:uncharacterized membrane protein HdeD (DUF308 family)